MSSVMTPQRLQKRVDEWREAREKKLAGRLQLNSDKKRTVSAMVLGLFEKKPVQLPTPPSMKYSGVNKDCQSSEGLMKKSYSYGDVRNYQQQQRHSAFGQDYRNDGGMSRQEPRSPYGYRQTQPHHPKSPHHPTSPHHYNVHDYRSYIAPRSEPRKSFASSSGGYRPSYAPSGGYRNQHQTPTSSYHNKGIRKTTDQPQGQKPSSSSDSSQGSESRKSFAPRERVVTFEDERQDKAEVHADSSTQPSEVCPGGTETTLSVQVESTLNNTFTLDDGESNVENKTDIADIKLPNIDPVEETGKKDVLLNNQIVTVTENVSDDHNAVVPTPEIIIQITSAEIDCEPTASEVITETETNRHHEAEEKKGGDMNSKCVTAVSEMVVGSSEDHKAEASNLYVVETEGLAEETDSADSSSFSLCLEAESSPVAQEVVIESSEVDIHEDLRINEVYISDVTEGMDPCHSNEIEVSDPLAYDAQDIIVPPQPPVLDQKVSSITESAISNVESTESEFSSNLKNADVVQDKENSSSLVKSENVTNDLKYDQEKQDPSTTEPLNKVAEHDTPKKRLDEITENLDVMYITPAKSARKSRVLLDSTNIVESSTIKYVVRDVKHKDTNDVVITPVRRSTRKKAQTPSSLKVGDNMETLSPEVLRKVKIVQNPFLKTQ